MPLRGEVYFPDTKLPPGQDIAHRCVVLSPNALLATQGNRIFVNVAIIRSAVAQNGRRVNLVPGHSILVTPRELPCLTHDSFIETHQIFAIALAQFSQKRPVGRLPPKVLDQVLDGARRLFT